MNEAPTLVRCVAYQAGRTLAEPAVGDVPQYLARPDCFVWIALHDPAPATLAGFGPLLGLHPLALEDALSGGQRPKLEEYGEALFVVLHTLESAGGELHSGEVYLFAGRNYLLSVRRHSERGFAEVRQRCEHEPELLRHGPGYALYALMDSLVDRYFPVLAALESEFEAVEAEIFTAASPRASVQKLYALKQRLLPVRHAVAPLLEAVSNLHGQRVPPVCAPLRDYFRDIYDHLQRLDQTTDSLRESLATAIAVNLSMITLQESDNMKRLAAYAALLAVPTMIAGIYGMNFEFMPELHWHAGYPASLALMALADALVYYRLKAAGWL